jgi:hypothetical protein
MGYDGGHPSPLFSSSTSNSIKNMKNPEKERQQQAF